MICPHANFRNQVDQTCLILLLQCLGLHICLPLLSIDSKLVTTLQSQKRGCIASLSAVLSYKHAHHPLPDEPQLDLLAAWHTQMITAPSSPPRPISRRTLLLEASHSSLPLLFFSFISPLPWTQRNRGSKRKGVASARSNRVCMCFMCTRRQPVSVWVSAKSS